MLENVWQAQQLITDRLTHFRTTYQQRNRSLILSHAYESSEWFSLRVDENKIEITQVAQVQVAVDLNCS